MTTATGPTARTVARSSRGPFAVTLALVLTGIALWAYAATGPGGSLDPAAYDPEGAHAIAALLEERGVSVQRVETAETVTGSEGTTVFVPVADALTEAELEQVAQLGTRLVVVGATDARLAALGVDATDATDVDVEPRSPACVLRPAVVAGDVDLGGITYVSTGEATECYATSGRATLVRAGDVTLLGAADLFTNDRLARRGNAALALGLLGTGTDVQWLLPRPGARSVDADRSLNDLVPWWLKLAGFQLLVVMGVVALWRARSLGPVVSEPLPVIVRAAESVEGRSRLYRASRSRPTAAEALRAGARDRLARRLGLGPETSRPGMVSAVVAHIGGDPVALDALLYGAAPTDDDALVVLADDLDILIMEVAGS
ncbi:MAG: DUF4350 domain-containing protein [Frankiaceae bacterium]|nr:DUF4350 domain-containing protein [Frankiaceae bacterium]